MLEIYALLTLLQRDRAAMSDGTPAALSCLMDYNPYNPR